MMNIKIIIKFLLLTLCMASHSEVYKWVDEKGKTHYSDEYPEDKSLESEVFQAPGLNIGQSLDVDSISIKINIYIHKQSKWSKRDVSRRIAAANNYFREHCKVSFDVMSITIGNANGLYEYDSWENDYKFAYLNPDPVNAIFVIFTGRERKLNKTGYSWRDSAPGRHPALSNTIYMFETTIGYVNANYEPYDIVVHEFAHVLLDSSHNDTRGNILSGEYDGMDITMMQCEKIHYGWDEKTKSL